jgi:uncharacterized membrane protein YqjE
VLESLRRLLVQLVALLQVRLELLSTEVSAELQRILRVLAWGVAALLFGALALLLTALTVVIALWDESRVLASVVVTAVFFLIAAVAAWRVWRDLTQHPRLLQGTLDELRRDGELIAGHGGERKDDPT